jgi:hypothetical protein
MVAEVVTERGFESRVHTSKYLEKSTSFFYKSSVL